MSYPSFEELVAIAGESWDCEGVFLNKEKAEQFMKTQKAEMTKELEQMDDDEYTILTDKYRVREVEVIE